MLRTLEMEDGISQRELSLRVGTTEPTVLSAVRLLERDGLLRRSRNAVDRRTINVYLTESARALIERLNPDSLDVVARAMADIPEEEVAQLRATLQKIRANLMRETGSD